MIIIISVEVPEDFKVEVFEDIKPLSGELKWAVECKLSDHGYGEYKAKLLITQE